MLSFAPGGHAFRRGTTGWSRRSALGASGAIWFLLGSSLLLLCEAAHEELKLDGAEQLEFLVQDIGLEPGARVDLDITSDLLPRHHNIWVFLLTREQYYAWKWEEESSQNKLPDANGNGVGVTSYLTNSFRVPLGEKVQVSFEIRGPGKARYFLCVLNIDKKNVILKGSMDFVNPGGNYLRLQEVHLPTVLLGSFWLFFVSLCLFGAWIWLAKKWGFLQRSSPYLLALFAANLAVKGISLILWWWQYKLIIADGTGSSFLSALWKMFDKVYDILELMMFMLISMGWTLLRSSLSLRERRLAIIVSVNSMFLGLQEVFCSTSRVCNGFNLSRYLLHSLVYLIIICAMNVNLSRVNHQVQEGPATLETGKLYTRFEAYKAFRIIFLVFIVAPTVEITMKVWLAPWEASWLYVLVVQLRTWGIFVAMITVFALLPDAPSIRIIHDLTQDQDVQNANVEMDSVPLRIVEDFS